MAMVRRSVYQTRFALTYKTRSKKIKKLKRNHVSLGSNVGLSVITILLFEKKKKHKRKTKRQNNTDEIILK